jgi:hypothetical protein
LDGERRIEARLRGARRKQSVAPVGASTEGRGDSLCQPFVGIARPAAELAAFNNLERLVAEPAQNLRRRHGAKLPKASRKGKRLMRGFFG